MSASVEELRTRLEDERERVVDVIANRRHEGSIEDEVEEHPLDNHPAEMASVTVDREIDLSLQESSEYVLAAIDAALLRIEDGTYGRCARCGRDRGGATRGDPPRDALHRVQAPGRAGEVPLAALLAAFWPAITRRDPELRQHHWKGH